MGWNENSRFDLVRAIVEEHSYKIDSYAHNTGDKSFYKNHYYSEKAPGTAFLAVPAYGFAYEFNNNFKILKKWRFLIFSMFLLTIICSCIPAALCVVILFDFLIHLGFTRNNSLISSIAFGLGTPFFHSSIVFFSHALGAMLGFSVFVMAVRIKNNDNNLYFFVIGLFSGLAIITEYSTIIIVVMTFGYMLIKKKFRVIIFLGLLLGLVPLLTYNYEIYGTVYPVGYYTNMPEWNDNSHPIDIVKIQNEGSFIQTNFLYRIIKYKFVDFKFDDIYIAFRILFFPYRGLFFYNPLFILGIPGLILLYKKFKWESLTILGIFILYLFFLIHTDIWWGGKVYGIRHLTPVTPLLMFFVTASIERFNKKVIMIFLVFSIILTFLGLQVGETKIQKRGYYSKQNSFEILYNPISEHYFPLFLENGVRTRLFENYFNDKKLWYDIREGRGNNITNPEIRHPLIEPFYLKTKFISIIPLFLVILCIWNREISGFLLKKNRLIFV